MRKNIVSLFIACVAIIISFRYACANDIQTDSRISSITVYPDSALVSRTATLKLNAGTQKVIFSDIIPEVDEDSLRVSSTAQDAVKISAAQVKKEFLKDEAVERVKQLQEEIEKLNDNIKQLENSKEVLSQDKQFLDSIRLFSEGQIPKDLVTKMPAMQDLDNTYKFLDSKLRENYAQFIDAELQIREIKKKIDVLRRELSQLSGRSQKVLRSIALDLEASKATSCDVIVSYLVRGASWQPIYDARADFDKSEVELVAYGIITQNTGEDWPEAEVFLSTAKPSIGGRMPYVSPWFIRPFQPRVQQDKMMRRKDATLAFQSVAFEKSEALDAAGAEAPAPEYSQAQEKGIAVVYKLLTKSAIKSDGFEHKLPVSSQVLKAKFEYSAFPRALLQAYLGSRVENAPNLQLLSGKVNIFLAGDFVGSSSIDTIGPQEEFDLYLGVDENVKVKRDQIERKVDETLVAGIPSSTKRTTYKFRLQIENYKSKKISAKLFEAMAVPEDDRIKVKVSQVSLEPKEKDWKNRKGVWLWELELEPKGKKEIFYTLEIEHPREMQVEGL